MKEILLKWWTQKKLEKAINLLTSQHFSATTAEEVCDFTYLTNHVIINNQTEADWLEVEVGDKIPIAVIVVHGDLVGRLFKFVNEEAERDKDKRIG